MVLRRILSRDGMIFWHSFLPRQTKLGLGLSRSVSWLLPSTGHELQFATT